MSYRTDERTISEQIAYIEERLRRLNSMYVTAVGFPSHEHLAPDFLGHTHDLEGLIDTTIVGGSNEQSPGVPNVGEATVAVGDYIRGGISNTLIGFAVHGMPELDDPNTTFYYSEDPRQGFYNNLIIGKEGSRGGNTIYPSIEFTGGYATNNIMIGHGRAHVPASDIAISNDIYLGTASDGIKSGGGNVLIGSNSVQISNVGLPDATYNSQDPFDWEVANSVLIGYDPYISWTSFPGFDFSNITGSSYNIVLQASQLFQYWGEDNIGIGAELATVVGHSLINIGNNNFMERFTETNPPIGSPGYHIEFADHEFALALGHDLYPDGDYAVNIGFNVGTNRLAHMLVSADGFGGSAFGVYGHIELGVDYKGINGSSDGIAEGPVVSYDCTSGNRVFTLKAIYTGGIPLNACDLAPDYGYFNGRMEGEWLIIRKSDPSANTLTINATAPDTIDGAASVVLSKIYDYVELIAIWSNYGVGLKRTEWMVKSARIGSVVIGPGQSSFVSTYKWAVD